MFRVEFGLTISTDKQNISERPVVRQAFEKIKGRWIDPLQVVQEQDERMLGLGEHADKAAKGLLESDLTILWRHFRRKRLLADDQRKLRNEIDDEFRVQAERIHQCAPPLPKLDVTPVQQLLDDLTKRLGQRCVRNVRSLTVEFSGAEKAAREDELLVQF